MSDKLPPSTILTTPKTYWGVPPLSPQASVSTGSVGMKDSMTLGWNPVRLSATTVCQRPRANVKRNLCAHLKTQRDHQDAARQGHFQRPCLPIETSLRF